ncbi:MAG: replication restart helicase PriA [Patescibacteria group bacterium]
MFAEVILSQRFPKHLGIFDYAIPDDLTPSISLGMAVRIPFRSSIREGVVIRIKKRSAISKKIKNILGVIGDIPLLSAEQILLAEWVAQYYAVSIGTVIKTMLPPIPKQKRAVVEPSLTSTTILPDSRMATAVRGIKRSTRHILFVPSAAEQSGAFYRAFLSQSTTQTLIIVPETDCIHRIASYVPVGRHKHVIPFHGGLNTTQAYHHWRRIQSDSQAIIIGTKQALFAPIHNLSAVIIDREENQNHHQSDQNPRFDARIVARQLVAIHQSQLISLSPAPSVTTYAQVERQHAQLVQPYSVSTRQSHVIDMRTERKNKNFSVLSEAVTDAMRETLSKQKKVVLIINKRGAAAAMMCRDCGLVVPCPSCGQPLAYHHQPEQLFCHRCNTKAEVPLFCSNCGGTTLIASGIGTQSVESYVRSQFPSAHCERIDGDTPDIDHISGEVIIGTTRVLPMIQWQSIGTACVISADTFLHLADYRAAERTWQLLSYLNFHTLCPLFIQTFTPDMPIFQFFPGNMKQFYSLELAQRKKLGYPPFGSLIKLMYQHTDKTSAVREATRLYSRLNATPLDTHVITPLRPFQHKKWTMYILLRYSPQTPKSIISRVLQQLPDGWQIDRDPETIL